MMMLLMRSHSSTEPALSQQSSSPPVNARTAVDDSGIHFFVLLMAGGGIRGVLVGIVSTAIASVSRKDGIIIVSFLAGILDGVDGGNIVPRIIVRVRTETPRSRRLALR